MQAFLIYVEENRLFIKNSFKKTTKFAVEQNFPHCVLREVGNFFILNVQKVL